MSFLGLDFTVVSDNLLYFMIGQYPAGPLGGLALTMVLACGSVFFSLFGGLALGLLTVAPARWVRWPAEVFVQTLRGVPLLMVIFWFYFFLPVVFGKGFPEIGTVVIALTLFTSAYMAQIVKAGIYAVPRGQWEAGVSSGFSRAQIMRYLVLPQALRNMIPSFVNQLVSLIKDTSLAFIVGVSELTSAANQVNNRTLNYPTEIFLFIALVYFVICFAFTSLSRRLEGARSA